MSDGLCDILIQTVRDTNPTSVHELVQIVSQRLALPESTILDCVLQLQNTGRIRLAKPASSPSSFARYLLLKDALWFWTTLAISALTATLVLIFPVDFWLFRYLRYVLGVFYVLWLPGYLAVKAIFPRTEDVRASSSTFDIVESLAVSICLSIAIVPLVALLLALSPFGISLIPLLVALLILTLSLSVIAITREYVSKRKKKSE